MNIRTIGSQLPARMFMRVSKSYIINNLHIISFDADFIYIGNEEIPLGISYREAFWINMSKIELLSTNLFTSRQKYFQKKRSP